MSITHTAQHVAGICEQKNAAYGDSVAASAQALRLLYPDGLHPEQYLDAIFAAPDFDKRSRLAQLTHESADGADEATAAMVEDALLDIAGYALLRLHKHNMKGKAPAPCASVNEDAVKPSLATLASAERRARPLMPLNSAASGEVPNSKPHVELSDDSSAWESTRPASARAQIARTPASVAAAAGAAARRRLRWGSFNVLCLCAGWLGYDFYLNVPATPQMVLLALIALLFFAASFIPPIRIAEATHD